MTKIYKINGKEIYGITKNELSRLASKHRTLWYILRDLLEALSDKEGELCEHGNNPAKGYCLGCYNEAIKPKFTIGGFVKKDEQGNWVGCLGYEQEGMVVGINPLKVVEKPKQQECLHLKQKILHKLDGSTEETCRDCGKDIGGSKQEVCQKCPRFPNAIIGTLDKDGNCNRCTPKQSTSLRNQIEKELSIRFTPRGSGATNDFLDEALSLIQSHIIKEIDNMEIEVVGNSSATVDQVKRLINKTLSK